MGGSPAFKCRSEARFSVALLRICSNCWTTTCFVSGGIFGAIFVGILRRSWGVDDRNGDTVSADFRLDLLSKLIDYFWMFLEEKPCIIAALAKLLTLEREPRSALINHIVLL